MMEIKQKPHSLNPDQVKKLIEDFQKSDNHEEAQMQLVENYQGLVVSMAKKYSRGGTIHDDLVQVGMIGLLGAIRRFDPSLGKSFESFAIPTIIGEIKRFIRDKTWSVHVPRRIKELNPKIKKAVEMLTSDLQRSPQVIEIAEHIGASEEDVLEAMEMGRSYHALSVDSKIEADSEGSKVTLLDLVPEQEEGYESIDRKMVLEEILHVLTDRERDIIKCTYYNNMSQQDAGDYLGISQMHVSRLQRRALKKLREELNNHQQMEQQNDSL